MIVTDLSHLSEQVAATPALQTAINWLHSANPSAMSEGKIEIDGERVYAFFQVYDTLAPDAPVTFEAHRQYLDIQYVVSGKEVIGWAPIERVAVTKPFDGTIDALLGTVAADEATSVKLTAGQLAVLYPADAHAPRLPLGASSPVKKIVVKVAVDG
jgi:biofilm protein TabA